MTPLAFAPTASDRRHARPSILSLLARCYRLVLPRRRIDARELGPHLRRDIGLED